MNIKVFNLNYDGVHRAIVAAKTQKEAAKALGVSVHNLRTYGSVTGNKEQIAVATFMLGTPCYQHNNSREGEPWYLSVQDCINAKNGKELSSLFYVQVDPMGLLLKKLKEQDDKKQEEFNKIMEDYDDSLRKMSKKELKRYDNDKDYPLGGV